MFNLVCVNRSYDVTWHWCHTALRQSHVVNPVTSQGIVPSTSHAIALVTSQIVKPMMPLVSIKSCHFYQSSVPLVINPVMSFVINQSSDVFCYQSSGITFINPVTSQVKDTLMFLRASNLWRHVSSLYSSRFILWVVLSFFYLFSETNNIFRRLFAEIEIKPRDNFVGHEPML